MKCFAAFLLASVLILGLAPPWVGLILWKIADDIATEFYGDIDAFLERNIP